METLEIEGKSYVAAKAAARQHRYTSDYIGQLIRGGKLTGKKVGRAWYVEIDSLDRFIQSIGNPSAEAIVHEYKPVVLPRAIEAEEPAIVLQAETPEETPVPIHISKKPIEVSSAARHELNEAFPLRYMADDGPFLPTLKSSRDSFIQKPISAIPKDNEALNVPIRRGEEKAHSYVAPRIEEEEIIVPRRDMHASKLQSVRVEFNKDPRGGFLSAAIAGLLFTLIFSGALISGVASKTITYGSVEKSAAGVGFAIPFSF